MSNIIVLINNGISNHLLCICLCGCFSVYKSLSVNLCIVIWPCNHSPLHPESTHSTIISSSYPNSHPASHQNIQPSIHPTIINHPAVESSVHSTSMAHPSSICPASHPTSYHLPIRTSNKIIINPFVHSFNHLSDHSVAHPFIHLSMWYRR